MAPKTSLKSRPQEHAGFFMARRGMAVGAGGDAGQGHELPPAEGRPAGREFLAHGAVILLGMQGTVLADGVTPKEIEHGPGRAAERPVALDGRGGVRLVIGADSGLRLADEMVGRL